MDTQRRGKAARERAGDMSAVGAEGEKFESVLGAESETGPTQKEGAREGFFFPFGLLCGGRGITLQVRAYELGKTGAPTGAENGNGTGFGSPVAATRHSCGWLQLGLSLSLSFSPALVS